MNQKELTKTFMMISNGKNLFGLYVFYKNIQRFKGYSCMYHMAHRESNSFNEKW